VQRAGGARKNDVADAQRCLPDIIAAVASALRLALLLMSARRAYPLPLRAAVFHVGYVCRCAALYADTMRYAICHSPAQHHKPAPISTRPPELPRHAITEINKVLLHAQSMFTPHGAEPLARYCRSVSTCAHPPTAFHAVDAMPPLSSLSSLFFFIPLMAIRRAATTRCVHEPKTRWQTPSPIFKECRNAMAWLTH